MNGVAVGAVVALSASLVAVLALAVRRQNGAAVVNAAVSLAVAAVAVAGAAQFRLGASGLVVPELALWAAAAGLLHSVGMLGPYDSVWWWDHLTHTVSAALLAALVYAGVLVAAGDAWSSATVAAATVAYTAVGGVFWEVVELVARALGERYDIEPVLVHYGWRDTAYDLLFDVVGGVAVVVFDVRVFVPLAADAPAATRLVLVATVVVLLGVSVLAGALLVVRSADTA